MIALLSVIGFLLCGGFSIILFILGCKFLRYPQYLWDELQRIPYNKSYGVVQRILK